MVRSDNTVSGPEIRRENPEQAALSDRQNTRVLPSQPYCASHQRRFPIHWLLWKHLCNRYRQPTPMPNVSVLHPLRSLMLRRANQSYRALLGCREIRHGDLQCPPQFSVAMICQIRWIPKFISDLVYRV
jgi:hypothetical protein